MSPRQSRRSGPRWLPAIVGIVIATVGLTAIAVAAPQHSNPWMFFAWDDRANNTANGKHIDISGSSNTFQGAIKSNGDFDAGGSSNIFNGIVRRNDNDGTAGSNTYNAGAPAFEAFQLLYPGTLATYDPSTDGPACMHGTSLVGGTNITLAANAPDGVYCTGSGNISAPNSNTDGAFTLITLTGRININGSDFDMTPYADNLLAYSNQTADQFGIDISGSNGSTMTGVVFAKSSDIKFQGSNSTFCVQAAAQQIQVSGSNNVFNQCLGPNPTPSPSPSPSPSPTPVITPSPTPVITPSPTPVITPSPTPVITPSPTPVITPSPTPVITPSPTPVVTPEPDAGHHTRARRQS